MMNKRIAINYIEHENADKDDIAGIIINVLDKDILIGITERHGSDAEVRLDIEKAKELVSAINSAIEIAFNN